MTDAKRFMILGTQRSGTTLVLSTLKKYPSITAFDEVFLASRKADFTYKNYISKSLERRIRNIAVRSDIVSEYLSNLLDSQSPSTQAVGFKVMYDQLSHLPYRYPSVLQYARRENIKIIHVIRINVLRIALSKLVARKRSMFHSSEQDLPIFDAIHVEPDWLVKQMDRISRQQHAWRERTRELDSIEVHYEDLVTNKEDSVEKMLKFLGVRSTDFFFSSLRKVSPERIDEIIANYDEVVAALSGSPHEAFLFS